MVIQVKDHADEVKDQADEVKNRADAGADWPAGLPVTDRCAFYKKSIMAPLKCQFGALPSEKIRFFLSTSVYMKFRNSRLNDSYISLVGRNNIFFYSSAFILILLLELLLVKKHVASDSFKRLFDCIHSIITSGEAINYYVHT